MALVAAGLYLREGAPALENYLSRLRSTGELFSILFDDRARPLAGRLTSVPDPDWMRRTMKSTTPQVAFASSGPRIAVSVDAINGQRFIFVSDLVFKPKGFFRTEAYKLALRLLAILLTAGLVCYWLDSYNCLLFIFANNRDTSWAESRSRGVTAVTRPALQPCQLLGGLRLFELRLLDATVDWRKEVPRGLLEHCHNIAQLSITSRSSADASFTTQGSQRNYPSNKVPLLKQGGECRGPP